MCAQEINNTNYYKSNYLSPTACAAVKLSFCKKKITKKLFRGKIYVQIKRKFIFTEILNGLLRSDLGTADCNLTEHFLLFYVRIGFCNFNPYFYLTRSFGIPPTIIVNTVVHS